MSTQKKNPLLIAVFIVGAASVLCILALLMGGLLTATRKPTPTAEAPSPTPMPSPTTVPTSTPLPTDASILQEPQGVSNLYIEYILDASGSMLELLADGTPKREAAVAYLIEHLLTFEPETHIGLRAYGHRVPWQESEEESCQDIELIAPVEVGQMETIAEWLDDFEALGMTPLHASVEMALEDFETDDPDRLNNIILISDGIETCDQDPCALAETAKAKGINFVIHVVGLDVDAETRAQLSCIADKGGGVYYDVHESDELQDALDSIQEDVQADEQIVPFAEATQTAMPPTPTRTPRPTTTPTRTPQPTKTPTRAPTRTPTPQTAVTPTQIPPTKPPSGCTIPTIVEFYAAPPPQGSTARFTLHWNIQGADRVEIFGHPVNPQSGTFDVWDDEANYWVLWAKVNETPDDCYAEKAIHVDPDSIGSPTGFSDVTVSQRDIQISVRDNAAIDGDRIDLFVNGVKVLSNYTLTSSPYPVAVTLNSGENTVKVTALNEGKDSPNTVEVRVSHVTSGAAVQVSQGLRTGESASFTIHAP
jgi:hypothetical protein